MQQIKVLVAAELVQKLTRHETIAQPATAGEWQAKKYCGRLARAHLHSGVLPVGMQRPTTIEAETATR